MFPITVVPPPPPPDVEYSVDVDDDEGPADEPGFEEDEVGNAEVALPYTFVRVETDTELDEVEMLLLLFVSLVVEADMFWVTLMEITPSTISCNLVLKRRWMVGQL